MPPTSSRSSSSPRTRGSKPTALPTANAPEPRQARAALGEDEPQQRGHEEPVDEVAERREPEEDAGPADEQPLRDPPAAPAQQQEHARQQQHEREHAAVGLRAQRHDERGLHGDRRRDGRRQHWPGAVGPRRQPHDHDQDQRADEHLDDPERREVGAQDGGERERRVELDAPVVDRAREHRPAVEPVARDRKVERRRRLEDPGQEVLRVDRVHVEAGQPPVPREARREDDQRDAAHDGDAVRMPQPRGAAADLSRSEPHRGALWRPPDRRARRSSLGCARDDRRTPSGSAASHRLDRRALRPVDTGHPGRLRALPPLSVGGADRGREEGARPRQRRGLRQRDPRRRGGVRHRHRHRPASRSTTPSSTTRRPTWSSPSARRSSSTASTRAASAPSWPSR